MTEETIQEITQDQIDILSSSQYGIIAIEKAKAKDALPFSEYKGEIGSTGLNIWGGRVNQEFLLELQGIKGYRVYEEMRKNDPVIGGLLFATEQAIRRVRWFPKPPIDVEGSQYDKAVEFLEQNMHDMSHSWNDFISEALTFLPFGYSAFEECYKERLGRGGDPRSRYDDGLIGWKKFGYRPPDTVEKWEIGDDGSILGLWQRDIRRPMAPVFIPMEKLVLFRTRRERNNPEGLSILRNAYKPYFFKKELEKFEAIALERTGAGIPVMILPLGYTRSDLEAAKKIVRSIRVDEQMGVTLPPGWELKLLRPEGRAETQTYEVAINRYSNHILMSLLLTFIALGTNNVGSFALVRAQQDFFRLALVGWVSNMSETMNLFSVQRLFELNAGAFPEEVVMNPPTMQTTDVGEYDLETLGAFIANLGKVGFITPDDNLEDHLRRISDMPPLEELKPSELDRDQIRQSALGAKNPELSDTEIEQDDKSRADQRDMQAKALANAGTTRRPYGNKNAPAKPAKKVAKKVLKNDKEIRDRLRTIAYTRGGEADVQNIMEINRLVKEGVTSLNGHKDDEEN